MSSHSFPGATDGADAHGSVRKPYRFVHKDGSPNVIRDGEQKFSSFNIYHYLLRMPLGRFFLLVLAFYTSINFIFATIYYFTCVSELQGLIPGSRAQTFEEAFFFSSQTLTTVGYGRISPTGLLSDTIASFEALLGILTLAIITGTLYGKFVRPRAYIRFSNQAVRGPFEGHDALVFRLVSSKRTNITDLEIKVTLSMRKADGSGYQFLPLKLESTRLNALYLSWAVVHRVDAESPLFGMDAAAYKAADVELLVHLTGYDEHFNSNVVARTSYVYDEIIHGATFVPMYRDYDAHTVLYLNRLDQWESLPGFSRA